MLLLQLFALHFLCDFPLQGDFLARGKNHLLGLPGVPWVLCLVAHAAIHAGAVSMLVPWWAVLVVGLSHLVIDYAKSAGWFGTGERAFWIDQELHLAVLTAVGTVLL